MRMSIRITPGFGDVVSLTAGKRPEVPLKFNAAQHHDHVMSVSSEREHCQAMVDIRQPASCLVTDGVAESESDDLF